MKSRDEIIAALADDILSGCFRNLPHVATVLDSVLDEPLVSNDDAAQLLFGSDESKLNTQERCEKAALAVVVSWLTSSPRGKVLVDERIERERDEADDDETHEAAA